MPYCLSCGNLRETVNGLCRQCQEDAEKRKDHPTTEEQAMTFEYLEQSAKSHRTKMAKAMRRAVRWAKVFGARWW